MLSQQSTERACDRCRERRVKCDKRQPACLRCEKLGKSCPGYEKKRKFVDEGVSLRKKYQAASPERSSGEDVPVNGDDSQTATGELPDGQSLPRSRTAPFGQSIDLLAPLGQRALGLAQTGDQLASVDAGNSILESLRQPLPTASLSAVDTILHRELDLAAPLAPDGLPLDNLLEVFPFDDTTYDPAWFNLDPDIFYDNQTHSCGFIPDASIVDEVDRYDFNQSSDTTAGTPMSFSGIISFTGTGK
ncbi:hypothetical protein LTR53_015884 [Teratosphaeriaceae sp. CCFEE 6253]|nr:hypothetical protein LTR53_015884 [Teratosphaeriaceae sp. CCFEE 6253]